MNSNFKYVGKLYILLIIHWKLRQLNSFFVHPVTCVIMQKNGAGFYAGSSVYWDNSHDGKLSIGGDQTTTKQY